MKKIKLQLPTGEWDSLNTKFSPDDNRRVDQNAFTDGTKNIDTETDGTIRKMKGGTQFYTLNTSARDQHEAIFSDGTRHLLTVDDGDLNFTAGTAAATLVTGGYSTTQNFEFATTQDRVYFGNGVTNQVYDKTASYGDVNYSVPRTKDMGAQAPPTAPTAALSGSGNPTAIGDHTYKVTFLYYDSEESNGGPTSNLVTVTGSGEQVDLTDVPIGGYGVTARKIYRDDNDGVFVLVGTINDNKTTTFTDTAAAGTTPIPTDNGTAPTFNQVTLFLDRLWFAQISGEPFTLYFSEVGLPDIVQSTNFIDCNQEDPITALAVYRGRLIVFNRKSMGQILGDTKDSFRYDSIEGSKNQLIGCVDSRSIQETVINGVPILVWLSDRGVYGFNGSSVFYLSETIEDLINLNIRQTVTQKNESVDTNNADFNAGTLSDGITVEGGQVSVRGYQDGTGVIGNNPRRLWNDTSDWDGGDSLDNISTINQGTNMTIVADNSQEPANDGTKDNVIDNGGVGIKLEIESDFTGELSGSISGTNTQAGDGNFLVRGYYVRIVPEKSGLITSVSMGGRAGQTITTKLGIMGESGGFPDRTNILSSTTVSTAPHPTSGLISASIGATVTAGTPYYIFQETIGSLVTNNMPFVVAGDELSGQSSFRFNDSSFVEVTNVVQGNVFDPAASYDITQDPIANSGTWTSDIIDTESLSADPTTIEFTATYPTDTGSTTVIEAGSELDFAGNIIVESSQNISDLSGSTAITLGSKRYYQIKLTLTTDDDRVTPEVTTAVDFKFSTTAEWISESIDTTADSTTYNNLITTATTPGSSTVVTEIRTADTEGGLTAAPWVAFGSVTVRKFAQIRLTLTKDSGDRPVINSVDFDWTIVSNIISEAIDTNVDPSGWDIFRSDFDTNGGTVVFEMRSATTEGGLTSATWFTVTNGNFPPSGLDTDQWVQWRATITATDTNVPTVSSVTITWLTGDLKNVRAASIFFNKNYYLSVAELGNEENNMLLQLDANGKWRIKRGLGISTFGFFFNEPYFGQSTAGVIGKFLDGFTDLGTNIEVDIRTRAFDYSSNFFDNSEFIKVPESITIEGRGTGATYDVSYSLDSGQTFTNFTDVVTGSTTFTTTNNDQLFARVFRAPDTNGARTIMYRVHTNDAFDIKLHRIKATAFLTKQEPIITG